MENRNTLSAEALLRKLGLTHYTARHIQAITDFIENDETDVILILDQLGQWNDEDLAKANEWYEEWIKK